MVWRMIEIILNLTYTFEQFSISWAMQNVSRLGFPLHQLSTFTCHVHAHPENTRVLFVHTQMYHSSMPASSCTACVKFSKPVCVRLLHVYTLTSEGNRLSVRGGEPSAERYLESRTRLKQHQCEIDSQDETTEELGSTEDQGNQQILKKY